LSKENFNVRVLFTGRAGYVGSFPAPFLLGTGHKGRVLDDLRPAANRFLAFGRIRILNSCMGISATAKALRSFAHCEAIVYLPAIVGDPACAGEPDLAREINFEASMALIADNHNAGVPSAIRSVLKNSAHADS